MTVKLRMHPATIADAKGAMEEHAGPDLGGDNTLRRLNLAAFVGERYGAALVADWQAMHDRLHELGEL